MIFTLGLKVLEGKLDAQGKRLEELKSKGKPVGNAFRQLIAAMCAEEVRGIFYLFIYFLLMLPRFLISPSIFVSDSVW